MKKTPLLLCLMGLFSLMATTVCAQTPAADKIAGTYSTYNDETGLENSRVQLFKATNGKYYGKIVWLREPNENGKPKVDDQNPDKALQNKPLLGLQLLKGFVFDEKAGEWKDGTIYDPESGKTYNCFMKFDGDKHLKIRGFIGKAWMGLGRTTTWVRYE